MSDHDHGFDADVREGVLEGVARLAKGSKPTAKWRAMWASAIAPFSPEEVRAWCRMRWTAAVSPLMGTATSETEAVAAFWGIPAVAAHGTPALVGEWALRLHKADHRALAHAAIQALGELAALDDAALADEAIGQLQRLKGRIRHRVTAKAIATGLRKAAEARGLGAEDLQDLVVEDAGLGPDGSRRWEAGEYDLYLFLTDDGSVELSVFERKTMKALAKPPKAVREQHFAVLAEARAIQKVLSESLATQKARLESALETERAWPEPAWRRVFGKHPLMRHFARRLIWALGDGRLAAFDGTDLVGLDGRPLEDVGPSLRLAHPARLEAATLASWQHHVVTTRLVQPFKQLFREVYRPTEADLSVGLYSDRYAGVPVRHAQLYALLRSRGWSGLAGIGPTGYQGAKELAGHGLEAMIGFRQLSHYDDRARREVALEQLEFYPDPLPDWEPGVDRRVPIAQVPPVAYSEIARDLALVVGVAGTGHLPGPGPFPLEGGAEMRLALVRELLPQLGLEGEVALEGATARVAAGARDFTIHLGSGEVRAWPDDRALDLEGFERPDAPLYMPHEGGDAATSSILATLVWLVQYARHTRRG